MATENQKIDQMRSLVRAWRTSGTDKKAFCASHQINIHTFTYWVAKVENTDPIKQASASKVSGFIALTRSGVELPNAPLELRFPQGAIIRLEGSLNATSLGLLKSLLY